MKLTAKGISKQFPRVTGGTNVFYAVKETDFQLPAGILTVLEGRSGGGKTTMLNILSGLLAPSSGTVALDGIDLYQMSDDDLSRFRNQQFGVIPQGQSAVGSLTVLENVLLPVTVYGDGAGAEDRARELLEQLGIGPLADVLPRELSGGEMRRMAIARALIGDPEVIFADEPTGDLDDENTEVVFRILREIADRGKAVLLVTHEKEAERYADQVFHMDAGVLTEG